MKADFIKQLREMGYDPQEPTHNQVVFEYAPPVGRNVTKRVLLGFQLGDEFPAACPSGPHFKPIDEGWVNPTNAIPNYNNFGADWIYWSRPHPNWTGTNMTVREYMGHIKNLLINE